MDMTSAEIPEFTPAPEPAPMSEVARLMGVFVSPGQAFADIARRPRWWVPVLISALVTTAFLYEFSQRVGWELFFRQQSAQSLQLQQMDAAARARVETIQLAIAKYAAWGGGLVGPLLSAVVVAAVLLFFVNTVMGGGIKFKNMLAVVTYGMLPNVVRSLLAMVVMQLKPRDEFDLRNPVMVNAALFLPGDASAWMRALAGSLDLFTFWTMVLMAIGIAAGAKRMTTGKAFGMLLFPWALLVILQTAAAA